jgi:hypothetical protein
MTGNPAAVALTAVALVPVLALTRRDRAPAR